MLIYVYDMSDGKAYTKNRRRASSLLFRISNRSFVGDLPYKVIKQLILEFKADATKSSSTLILVQSNKGRGFIGWKGFFIGKPKKRYQQFLEAESYIDFSI